MIFCFSGTGNSEHAAKVLLQENEQLISMADAVKNNTFSFSPAADENVGFIFPVYFYGLPDTVRRFVKGVTFTSVPAYIYGVITCGGSIAGAGGLLKDFLAENGNVLEAVYSVKMPGNYVFMYDVTTQEEEKPILEKAEQSLSRIKEDLLQHRSVGTNIGLAAKVQTAILYPMYDRFRNTKKFYTDESCVGCGTCAARCPQKAIEMREGTPVWVKEKCDHCLSCVRCNAVQYGKRTVGKYRYKHPDLRKKSH